MTSKPSAPPLVNIEAERVVLGKILAADRLYYEVADRLAPEDFGDVQHQAIFRAMQALVSSGRPIARPSMQSQMVATGKLDGVDVASYLAALVSEGTQREYAKLSIEHFADIVVHHSARRQLINAAIKIKDRAVAATLETPIEELRGEALNLLSEYDDRVPDEAVKFTELMSRVIRSAASEVSGITTGLPAFDRLAGPLLPGQLIVIGGETSSGKTALAMHLVYLVGSQGIPVEVYELEMTAEEIASRWMAMMSKIETHRIAEGGMSESDLDVMTTAGVNAGDLTIWVDDRPAISVPTLQARLARAIRRKGIRLAVIDHLQYCRPNTSREKEHEEIKQVVDDIKAMAKRLKIPIILVSHVHRKSESKPIEKADDIKRPEMKDLYGSSGIEKAADTVVFVHRPSWFLERATPNAKNKPQHDADVLRWEGRAELVLCKNRQRKGFGVSECSFNEELTSFGR